MQSFPEATNSVPEPQATHTGYKFTEIKPDIW